MESKKCPNCGRFLYATNEQTVAITGANGQFYETTDITSKCKCGYEETVAQNWWKKFLP